MNVLLITLILFMEATMPVFANQNVRNAPPPSQPQGGAVPAWLQGNVAAQSYMQGSQSNNNTMPSYYGPKSQKRGRGNTIYRETPNAPKPEAAPRPPQGVQSNPNWLQELGQNIQNFGQLQPLQVQQNPAWMQELGQTVRDLNLPIPSWIEKPAQAAANLINPQTPYRIQNPDGTWSYLQADGTYKAATGPAGGVGGTSLRNSFVSMPPFMQLQPPTGTPTTGYSPFSSQYGGWSRGRGGGGGGGYNYGSNAYTPSWMMGLQSWNFGE